MQKNDPMLEKLLARKQKKARYYLGLVSPSHRKLWLDDPVTKSLIATIEARQLLNLTLIMAGAVDRETIEETALQAAKAQEIAREMEFLIDVIRGMALDSSEENDSETGRSQDNSETESVGESE